MLVLVDTTVWWLALRRRNDLLSPSERTIVAELNNLIAEGRVRLLGLVRQVLLSGIREHAQYDRLRRQLSSIPDVILEAGDHEVAADVCNSCRSVGRRHDHGRCAGLCGGFREGLECLHQR